MCKWGPCCVQTCIIGNFYNAFQSELSIFARLIGCVIRMVIINANKLEIRHQQTRLCTSCNSYTCKDVIIVHWHSKKDSMYRDTCLTAKATVHMKGAININQCQVNRPCIKRTTKYVHKTNFENKTGRCINAHNHTKQTTVLSNNDKNSPA